MALSKKQKRENLQFKDREDETLLKKPGELNGSSFQISNLRNCTVHLCDRVNTVGTRDEVYVDGCSGTRVFVGPVESSIFVRNSRGRRE